MTSSLQVLQRLRPLRVHENAIKFTYCCAQRFYQNPKTHVFERMHQMQLVGKGKYPLLKRKSYILKKLPPNLELYSKTMLCILTREILGIGLKGQVVEVTKSEFRNHLYPKGLAIYASPENIEKYDEIRKNSRDYGIDYEMKMALLKLSKTHIDVCMNMDLDWILDENHLRIALRKAGVFVTNENIVLDKEPITNRLGHFSFWIQLREILCVQVKGTIHPFGGTFEEPDSTEEENPVVTEDSEKVELVIEDENPVKYYEDVFGSQKASSDNVENIIDQKDTTAPDENNIDNTQNKKS